MSDETCERTRCERTLDWIDAELEDAWRRYELARDAFFGQGPCCLDDLERREVMP